MLNFHVDVESRLSTELKEDLQTNQAHHVQHPIGDRTCQKIETWYQQHHRAPPTHLHILDELREKSGILGGLLHSSHAGLDVVQGVLLLVLSPLVLSGADAGGEEEDADGGDGLEELHCCYCGG